MRYFSLLTAAAATLALAGTANAHPRLLSASPAANATVTSPARIELHFSERLVPAFSKAELTMAAMPGMAAMQIASAATVSGDGRVLVVAPRARLHSGRYTVTWHVVSSDTHKVAGTFAFAVK